MNDRLIRESLGEQASKFANQARTVSNADFLRCIFSALQSTEYLWSASFVTSPNRASNTEWHGTRLARPDDCRESQAGNSYFCVSALKGLNGEFKRKKDNFSRLFCIVLDDAGECAVKPTWQLRTSAEKVQIGFKLSVPESDLNVADRLHEQLSAGGKLDADKNGNNAVRYVRLPVGCNTKTLPHFQVKLEEFNPEISYDLGDLVDALGLDKNYIFHGGARKNVEGQGTERPERLSDSELIRLIVSGDSYHDPLLMLTARYANRGMDNSAILKTVSGFMEASHEAKTERWHSRYNGIVRIIKGAERFRPSSNQKREYRLLTADEIIAKPPMTWRIKRVLPANGLVAIFGPPSSAKSFLSLDMLAAIANGRDWHGYRCKRAPVIYVCLEGEAGLSQRLVAFRKRYGEKSTDGMLFLTGTFQLLEKAEVEKLAKAIIDAGGKGGVVCLDTLNQAIQGADENSSQDMGRTIAAARELQAILGGVVVLVHHSGKDAYRGLRGHSSLLAALDAAIEVGSNGENRSWKVAKSKDGADGMEHRFKLEVVNIGVDADSDSITSCVVVAEGQVSEKEKRLTKPQQRGLDALVDACNVAGIKYPDPQPGGIGARMEEWRQVFYTRHDATTLEAKRKAFERAKVELLSAKCVIVSDGIYRPAPRDQRCPGAVGTNLLKKSGDCPA